MRTAAALLLLAASAPHFDITDARGKKASGITLDSGSPGADGWYPLSIAKAKHDAVIVWPFDARAKEPDGPEPVKVITIQRGDAKALANARVTAAMAVPLLLGTATLDEIAHRTGFEPAALAAAFDGLASASGPFEKGTGLLYAKKPAEAADPLARALRERERQLTRFPSEIYPAAMLYGKALFETNQFDAAAVAYLKAMNQRPSDAAARRARAEALIKAGKPDAARELMEPK